MNKGAKVTINLLNVLLVMMVLLSIFILQFKVSQLEKYNRELDTIIEDVYDDLDDELMFRDDDINDLQEQIDKLKNNNNNSDSYVRIDSNKDDYEVFVIPNDVDIFSLTDDDLDQYHLDRSTVTRYIFILYDKNHVLTIDDGLVIVIYNQNGFYYMLVRYE